MDEIWIVMNACRFYRCLLRMRGGSHCCSCVFMYKLTMLLFGYVCPECISMFICSYAYIVMVKVVMHEVIVCSLCHRHANVLVEIDQEMQIIKVRLQHSTLG